MWILNSPMEAQRSSRLTILRMHCADWAELQEKAKSNIWSYDDENTNVLTSLLWLLVQLWSLMHSRLWFTTHNSQP
jgi:hypothetical protein